MRRSKIVCTLGPATNTYPIIRQLVDAGMNVARINRSHGTQEEHAELIEMVRKASHETHRALAVLVDLQGPKIRLGTFASGPVELKMGASFTITTREVPGDVTCCSTTYSGLPADCAVGDVLLIDDGNVQLRVTQVTPTDVTAVVEVPGVISDHKGINLPGVAVSVPALSPKDEEDLRWALHAKADYIALSFVRNPADIERVHQIMEEEGLHLPVIAKIEKPQAVSCLEEIIEAFDGVMVARGDLGVEMPLDEVPLVQKRVIEIARRLSKPVIVATQVLESMISNPRPTRAEASDCANAIFDGADAVMLSGETSVGAYPVEAVKTMAQICETAEERGQDFIAPLTDFPRTRSEVVAKAAVDISHSMSEVRLMAMFTQSGHTARQMASWREPIGMIACTPVEATRNQLALVWGVEPYRVSVVTSTDEMVWQLDQLLRAEKLAEVGDEVVMVAGTPPGRPGNTNSIRLHCVGEEVPLPANCCHIEKTAGGKLR